MMRDDAIDILEVLKVASRLARATDDRDFATYVACLAPEVRDGEVAVDGLAFARASMDRVAATR